MSPRMQRLLTGAVAAPLALLAVLTLPSDGLFVAVLLVVTGAAIEYARLARHWAPSAPLGVLAPLVAIVSTAVFAILRAPERLVGDQPTALALVAGLAIVPAAPALVILLSRTRVAEAGIAIGLITFGVPYFAAAILSLYGIHRVDPWLLVALLAIIWAGDTAAYVVGSRFGRHKMAPTISPNKTWEGAFGGFAASLAVFAGLLAWRLGEVPSGWLVVAALTAILGQAGDLVESLFKRGVGVKDSSNLLPGHGGLFDRLDALLLAAPAFLIGLWWLGWPAAGM